MKRRDFLGMAGSLAAACVAAPARAQSRGGTLRIVSGFPAGASVDMVARVLAEQFHTTLKRTCIVETRAGAGGRIAVEHVKLAPADGSTLLLTPASMMTVYPSTFRRLPYDPIADFEPVARVVNVQFGLAVGAQVPVNTLAEYLAWVKADPARGTYGSPATGSTPHFLGVSLGLASGLPLTAVHYKGSSPLINDLLGGHVPAAVNNVGDMSEYHRAGRLKVLAIWGKARSSQLPAVPTVHELGFALDSGGEEWYGVFAPRGTPRPLIDDYNRAIHAAVALPQVRDKFTGMGWTVQPSTPEELGRSLAEETVRWREIVKRSGYTPEE